MKKNKSTEKIINRNMLFYKIIFENNCTFSLILLLMISVFLSSCKNYTHNNIAQENKIEVKNEINSGVKSEIKSEERNNVKDEVKNGEAENGIYDRFNIEDKHGQTDKEGNKYDPEYKKDDRDDEYEYRVEDHNEDMYEYKEENDKNYKHEYSNEHNKEVKVKEENEYNNKEEKRENYEDTDGSGDISIIMVGDILLHSPVNRSCMSDDGKYDYTSIFENTVEEIKAADLALVNQEVIIGGEELGVTGYPSFNAPYEIGDALADAGFDVVCHATNHVLDRGKRGLVNCMDYWKTSHPEIAVAGLHESEDKKDDIYIYEVNGTRIAILNFTYGTNGIELPGDMLWSVELLREENVIKDIKKAEETADFTIVCPHWGTEYSLDVTEEQRKWSKLFCENGADLVIGTHPHVIEPIEWVEDGTGHRMLVYYSIGNFVNWTSGKGTGISNRMVGGMAKVDLGFDNNGNVKINDYGVEALVCHLSKEKHGVSVYLLRDYDDSMAVANEIGTQTGDFSRQYCVDLCNRIWGDIWE